MIRTPGKFEGCHEFAPYFYDQWLDGCFDEMRMIGDREVTVFEVVSEDTKQFPELRNYQHVMLWEDDVGFVHCIPTNELPDLPKEYLS